jgi:hypothetical protein
VTTAADLRAIAITALTGTTLAGTNVFAPRDISTWQGDYPLLIVTLSKGRGEGLGNVGPPKFDTTVTLRIAARVSHPATEDDTGAALVYEDLETLCDQVLAAVIRYPDLYELISEYPYFEWEIVDVGKEDAGNHLGEAVINIGLKWTQGPADFYQPTSVPLETISVDASGVSPDASGTVAPGLLLNFTT